MPLKGEGSVRAVCGPIASSQQPLGLRLWLMRADAPGCTVPPARLHGPEHNVSWCRKGRKGKEGAGPGETVFLDYLHGPAESPAASTTGERDGLGAGRGGTKGSALYSCT